MGKNNYPGQESQPPASPQANYPQPPPPGYAPQNQSYYSSPPPEGYPQQYQQYPQYPQQQYYQPTPPPQIIIQEAPKKKDNTGLCAGLALGACLCCCLDALF